MPGQSTARAAPGRLGGGKGEEGGGGNGIPPSLRPALAKKAREPARAACFRLRSRDPAACTGSTEPRSARRTGPSVPRGRGLRLRRHWGLTPHGVGRSSRGGPAGTPQPQAILNGCKTRPPTTPSSPFPPPEALEKGHHRREALGKPETVTAAVLDALPWLPVRTPTRI